MDGTGEARTGEGRTPGTRRIAAELWEGRQAARALLAEARAEAEWIRGDAERIRVGAGAEAEAARSAAVEAGREEGLALGLARAAAEVLRGAAERDRILAGCTAELTGLAVEMAEHILRREVRAEDGPAAAGRALAELRGIARVTLRASPVDLPALRCAIGEGLVRLVADPGLGPGEVVVEAGGASVDGRFRSQLAELRRAILEAGEPGEPEA